MPKSIGQLRSEGYMVEIRHGVMVVFPKSSEEEYVKTVYKPENPELARQAESGNCESCGRRIYPFSGWHFRNVPGAYCGDHAGEAEARSQALAPFHANLANVLNGLARSIPRHLRRNMGTAEHKALNILDAVMETVKELVVNSSEPVRAAVVAAVETAVAGLDWEALPKDPIYTNEALAGKVALEDYIIEKAGI